MGPAKHAPEPFGSGMHRGVLLAVVTAAEFVGGVATVATAAQDRTPARSPRVTVVGCVAQAADGALPLTSVTPSRASRSIGSNSAKASTPIGNATPAVDRPRTSGMTTPKGSTPINVAPASFTPSSTNGTNSPKASTPVRRSSLPSYALDAQGSDVASHAGHTVEVTGTLEHQRVLKVENAPSGRCELRAVASSRSPRTSLLDPSCREIIFASHRVSGILKAVFRRL